MTYQVKSPILFLIFNRPSETQIVFDAIKQVKPKKLYIAADGARNEKPNEYILVKNAREIINQIDWKCEVKTLFRETNLGCKLAVSGAISWFFDNEPEGIILEDDCLPSLIFFEYCDTLLDKYRLDTRIRHIGGSSMNIAPPNNNNTYYFSKLTNVWGWASWRRVWKDYDVNIKQFDSFIESSLFLNIFNNRRVTNYLINLFRLTNKGKINTWDYQYVFCNIINNGLSILPYYNMITNIGFNLNGTHTFDNSNEFANVPTKDFEKIVHPIFIVPDVKKDIDMINKQIPTFKARAKRKVKLFLKKLKSL